MKVNNMNEHSELSVKMNLQTKTYRVIWFLVFFGSIVYAFLFDTTISFVDLMKWLLFWIGAASFVGGILGISTQQITLKGFTYHGNKATRFGLFYIIFGIIICSIAIITWIN